MTNPHKAPSSLQFSKISRGNPNHPPLIFLHGFLGCKEDWQELFPFFEQKYHCIAFDLPGHGSTPYCEDLVSAVKGEILQICSQPCSRQDSSQYSRQCSQKPILIGYSMGGRIALRLKSEAKALVLISAHFGLKSKEEKEARRVSDEKWRQKLLTLPLGSFLSEWYAQPIFRSPLPLPPQALASRMRQNPQSLSQVLVQMSLAGEGGGRSGEAPLPCPTLCLHGEWDLKYEALYRTLPEGVAVRRVGACGHAAHLDGPRACSEAILGWFKELNH